VRDAWYLRRVGDDPGPAPGACCRRGNAWASATRFAGTTGCGRLRPPSIYVATTRSSRSARPRSNWPQGGSAVAAAAEIAALSLRLREAVIFASREPVSREVLARVVGPACNLDLLIDDIRAELRGRPYDLVPVAGGWHHRTRTLRRRHPHRRRAWRKSPAAIANRDSGPHRDCLLSAGHPRRALSAVRQGDKPRCDWTVAGVKIHRRRPAQPGAGRALQDALEEAGLLSKPRLLPGEVLADGSQSPHLMTIEEEDQEDSETDEPPLALSSEDFQTR
jgi:hypothetical protein